MTKHSSLLLKNEYSIKGYYKTWIYRENNVSISLKMKMIYVLFSFIEDFLRSFVVMLLPFQGQY